MLLPGVFDPLLLLCFGSPEVEPIDVADRNPTLLEVAGAEHRSGVRRQVEQDAVLLAETEDPPSEGHVVSESPRHLALELVG